MAFKLKYNFLFLAAPGTLSSPTPAPNQEGEVWTTAAQFCIFLCKHVMGEVLLYVINMLLLLVDE